MLSGFFLNLSGHSCRDFANPRFAAGLAGDTVVGMPQAHRVKFVGILRRRGLQAHWGRDQRYRDLANQRFVSAGPFFSPEKGRPRVKYCGWGFASTLGHSCRNLANMRRAGALGERGTMLSGFRKRMKSILSGFFKSLGFKRFRWGTLLWGF